jgi:hypothetical protein
MCALLPYAPHMALASEAVQARARKSEGKKGEISSRVRPTSFTV